MITVANKVCLKRIAIATMLLIIAQWAYGGMVICYGADGHVEIELPVGKDCCKKDKSVVSLNQTAHIDLDHCLDIPIESQQCVSSTRSTAPNHNHTLPHCMVSQSFFSVERTLKLANRRAIPPSYNPQLATLKTVVLLV